MKRVLSVFLSMVILSYSSTAAAHVVVKPAEVAPAQFQTFTVGVPNEKDLPTTQVKLVISDGVEHVTPTSKPGWQISMDKDGGAVKSITWQGGAINAGLRDDFTFSAKVPAQQTDLQWKAYQTYSDGTVVAWDQSDHNDSHDSGAGPFSVTKVVAATNEEPDDNSRVVAERAMYISIASVIVSLGAVFFATRKRA